MEVPPFFPHTVVGWFALVAQLLVMIVIRHVARTIGKQVSVIDAVEPEIPDPLEEEFRQLEQYVAERAVLKERLDHMKVQRNINQVLLARQRQMALRGCQHIRLRMHVLSHKSYGFTCQDCGQLVKTRARPI